MQTNMRTEAKKKMPKINETFAVTEFFKNIFPYADYFIQKASTYLPITLDELTNINLIYNILFNEYANCNVAYDTEDAFCRHFFLSLADEADVFIKKMELVDELRRMDINDLMSEMTSIANTAQNNNEIVDSPLSEILPYISMQNTSTSKINKAVAISRAISLYRSQGIREFLDKFRKHFINIHGEEFVFKK